MTVATDAADRPAAAGEHRDVVVVGAGVSGLATAWHLRDRDVLVLEEAGRVAAASAPNVAATRGSTSAPTCTAATARPPIACSAAWV